MILEAGNRSIPSRSATATLTVLPGFPADAGTFAATGTMQMSRSRHAATLLPGGKVLFTGGIGGPSGYLSSAELYDPATGLFSATGSMNVPRTDHTATLLPNGKVLIAGGGTGDRFTSVLAVSSAELYDPATGVFTAIASMASARAGHTATLLPNGSVLITGGVVSGPPFALDTAEVFQPVSGVFAAGGRMTVVRNRHTATLLDNGNVLLAGGSAVTPAAADVYDATTGLFTATALAGNVGVGAAAAKLANGAVLLAGGAQFSPPADWIRNAQRYGPAGQVSLNAELIYVRSRHTLTTVQNGKVLMVGGQGDNRAINRSELYDPVTDRFLGTGAFTAVRDGHTATLLNNGTVLIAGGTSNASADIFTP